MCGKCGRYIMTITVCTVKLLFTPTTSKDINYPCKKRFNYYDQFNFIFGNLNRHLKIIDYLLASFSHTHGFKLFLAGVYQILTKMGS